MSGKLCAVIIPMYKAALGVTEEIAVQQCFKILSNHDIIIIKPRSLQLDRFAHCRQVSFDDHYFEDVFGYNRLMLSAHFYETFAAYTYMLIYQTDAFVFKDALLAWCQAGFDYIGAPWLFDRPQTAFKALKERIRSYVHFRYDIRGKDGLPAYDKQLNRRVGNGGFSLRRIEKFASVCRRYQDRIEQYKLQKSSYFNEDIFFSVELNRKEKVITTPGYRTALQFAVETEPQLAFSLLAGELPFGCHAWEKNLVFWRPYLASAGYAV